MCYLAIIYPSNQHILKVLARLCLSYFSLCQGILSFYFLRDKIYTETRVMHQTQLIAETAEKFRHLIFKYKKSFAEKHTNTWKEVVSPPFRND